MEGLAQYSHVWVIFVFHCNTDLQRLWSPDHASDGLKAKVQVPRLNGERMGVLATRSPHRPSPIGGSMMECRLKGAAIGPPPPPPLPYGQAFYACWLLGCCPKRHSSRYLAS